MKLGLQGLRSTAPRQDSQSQSLLAEVKLDRLGPEQYARPVPPLQQLHGEREARASILKELWCLEPE